MLERGRLRSAHWFCLSAALGGLFLTACLKDGVIPAFTGSQWTLPGKWVEIGREPAIRSSGSLEWGDGRLFMWGGVTHAEGQRYEHPTYPPGYTGSDSLDGFVFNVEEIKWEEIGPAPVPFLGFDSTSIWTGTELLVWGPDHHRVGPGTTRSVGALYDPKSKTWRRMADPSRIVLGSDSWTGRELLVLGTDRERRTRFEAYDPKRNSWRDLTPPPEPLRFISGPSFRGNLAWTGRELLAGSEDSTVWVYDSADDSWRQSPMSPYHGRTGFAYGWAAGTFLQFGGGLPIGDMIVEPAGIAAYYPESNRWRSLSDPPVDVGPGRLLEAGERALFMRFDTSYSFDPKLDKWEPFAAPPRTSFGEVWTGDSLLSLVGTWPGLGEPYSPRRLFRYDVEPEQTSWLGAP